MLQKIDDTSQIKFFYISWLLHLSSFLKTLGKIADSFVRVELPIYQDDAFEEKACKKE